MRAHTWCASFGSSRFPCPRLCSDRCRGGTQRSAGGPGGPGATARAPPEHRPFLFKKLSCSSHTIKFSMYNSVLFSAFTKPCFHHYCLILEHFMGPPHCPLPAPALLPAPGTCLFWASRQVGSYVSSSLPSRHDVCKVRCVRTRVVLHSLLRLNDTLLCVQSTFVHPSTLSM